VDSIEKRQQTWNSVSAPWKNGLARVSSFSVSLPQRILSSEAASGEKSSIFRRQAFQTSQILLDAYGTGNAPVISGADLLPMHCLTVAATASQYYSADPAKTRRHCLLFNGTLGKHESRSRTERHNRVVLERRDYTYGSLETLGTPIEPWS